MSEQDAPAGAGTTATDATDPAQAPASQWPAGWYPDALRPWLVRWWDGGAWSDTVERPVPPSLDAASPDAARTGEARPPSASRRPLTAVLVAVVAAVAVAAGVNALRSHQQDVADHTVVRTTSKPAPGGGTRVGSHGVSVVLPSGWRNMPVTPAELKAEARAIEASNPALAAGLRQVTTGAFSRQLALFAVRPASAGNGFVDNVNVLVTPTGGTVDREMVAAQMPGALRNSGAESVVSVKDVVGGRQAVRLTYVLPVHAGGRTIRIHGVMYVVLDGREAATITVSSSDSSTDDAARAIATSVSFG